MTFDFHFQIIVFYWFLIFLLPFVTFRGDVGGGSVAGDFGLGHLLPSFAHFQTPKLLETARDVTHRLEYPRSRHPEEKQRTHTRGLQINTDKRPCK